MICFVILLSLKPVLERYTLAKPNARSSHKFPTPQGGGIAIIAAIIIAVATVEPFYPTPINEQWQLAFMFTGVIILATIGIIDDAKPIAALLRLLLQAVAATIVLASLPDNLRV